MKRRWRILIAALVVAMAIPIARHYQLRWATESYIAQLKARGEPMDLAQVLPSPVPPEQNSADTFRQAAALLNTEENWTLKPVTRGGGRWHTMRGDSTEAYDVSGMQMVAPGKAIILWQQPDIQDGKDRYAWQDIAAIMDRNEKTFALLQQIIDKPDFDFQIHYERGFDDPGFSTNLFLAESKRAAQRLATAALCDLHNGDTASAVTNVRAMLAMTQGLRDERYLISELVRMAIAQIAVDPSWELLQSPDITDAQLAQLQQDWTALDFIQSYEDALKTERAVKEITTTGERESNAQMKHLKTFYHLNDGEIFMWRNWWSYPDELRALKGWQVLITSMRMVQTNGFFQNAMDYQQQKLDALGIMKLLNDNNNFPFNNVDLHTMQSQSVADLSSIIRRVTRSEAAREMVITAIALKRYQIKHGNYPSDLKSLVPEFLPTIPLDPVDGNPLRYHPKANGTFQLYSIGENNKDDGGNPLPEQGIQGINYYWLNPHALDWVWPQPATPEEIQNYYAHLPK